ncbi:MAG: protoporphyrinogen oxidase [Firmicutes bacterium]|nr:protoporphyrinogen oxidase [Bacillota bacterium]
MRVAVVGGGITGLAAAYGLSKAEGPRGVEVTLYEQAPRLGGKILTERVDGFILEAGPDSFLTSKPEALALSRALGLGEDLVGTGPDRTVYVLSRGRLHPLPEGLALVAPTRILPFLRSGLFTLPEKARIGVELLLPPRKVDGDESLGAFVRRRLGQAALDRIAAPLLAGIYAGDADALSAQAAFPQLCQWERRHRSLILAGLAQQRRGATRQARPADRPAQEGDGGPPGAASVFLSLAGGMGELVAALLAALRGRVQVLRGVAVARIAPPAGRELAYTLHLDDGRVLRADGLVLTVPAFAAAGLLAPLSPAAAAALRQVPYASTAAVTLAYRRDAVAHPLDGHGFVVARDEPLAITACTWVSSKWPHRAPPELVLLRCYLGRAGADAIVGADDATLVDTARRDLRAVMGLDASPRLVHVVRWPRAMPQYLPGHLDRLAAIEAALAPLPRLALAGAGYRGVGVPDCIRQGQEAAARVLAALVPRPGTAPAPLTPTR